MLHHLEKQHSVLVKNRLFLNKKQMIKKLFLLTLIVSKNISKHIKTRQKYSIL